MKKLNLKKLAFSTLASGLVLGAPASILASDVDSVEECEQIFVTNGCGAHGCSGGSSTPTTTPNTDQDDMQNIRPNQPQTQPNPSTNPSTRGSGCGGVALKSSGSVNEAKRASLI